MSIGVWATCALVGAIGSVLRAESVAAITRKTAAHLPWGTLFVNLVGAFGIGLLHGAGVGGKALVVSGAALLGAYTTFSTWMLETVRIARTAPLIAAANLCGPLLLGLALAWLGNAAGKAL
ncbi:MAG: CrcB family protein [Solirubrobacterales bacterium]|nr:CrcB family protein [Solirubrobacterales bacterium]